MSMHNTMTHLSVIVSHHPSWGYFAAFFLSFLESLAVVGSIIPGAITMTAVGVMIGSGILGPWLAFFLAIIGALTGDTLSFYLGITYQDKLLRIWPLSRHPEWFEKGQRFFTKYGIAALIIGRFFGPMRSMVPLIAGVLQMQSRNFAMGIIPSAIIWAIVYLMPGILLGALSTSFPSEIAIEILVDGTLMIIAFWALWELINLCYHGISRRLVQIASRFVRLLKRHTWGSNLHQHLEDPLDPQALHQSYALLLAFFASIIFIMTAISSHHQGIITLVFGDIQTVSLIGQHIINSE